MDPLLVPDPELHHPPVVSKVSALILHLTLNKLGFGYWMKSSYFRASEVLHCCLLTGVQGSYFP